MFDEVNKIVEGFKVNKNINKETIGWVNNEYRGSPSNQAAKSRKHIKTSNLTFHAKMMKRRYG